MLIFKALYNYLPRPTCRNEIKMLLRAIFCGGVWNGFLLGKAKKENVPCRFCGKKDGRWSLILGVYFSPLPFSMFWIFLNLLHFCLLIVATGPGACFGMVGCLDSVALVIRTPGLTSFGDLASFHLERCLGAYPVDFASCWTPPVCWDADDIDLEVSEYPNIWTDGSREDFSSVGGFEVAVAGVYLPASELAFEGSVWGTAEEYGDARLERCRAFYACSRCHADRSAC